jgi:acyl-CoA reductase-like NAD-dependent aldehyde dehydrogenase
MATDLQIAMHKVASVNPATGEILREFQCASEAEVRAAVGRARAAQPAWNGLGLRKRIAVLRNFQRRLYEKKSEIATAITREAGKPYAEALVTEVLVVLDATRFLIENAYRLLGDEAVPHGNLATKLKSGQLIREPYGVVGIISPWNYPFSIPATETLAALVTGNTLVLKPSELTSLVALELQSLLHAAGVPQDVFQVVIGDGAAGSALAHSSIEKLVFTGSVATGKRIAMMAAERLLPVVLELGGKDPMLVLDDADVDVASSVGRIRQCGAGLPVGGTLLCTSQLVREIFERVRGEDEEVASGRRYGSSDGLGTDDSRTAVTHRGIALGRREGSRSQSSGGRSVAE